MRISQMQVLAGAALVAVIAAVVSQPARADDEDTPSRYAVAWLGTIECGTTPTSTLCQH